MTVVTAEQVERYEAEDAAPFAVESEEMSVSYGRRAAVRNLTMHVPYGSIYGLVGPSGAGKTTAMRALATLEPSVTGTVLVDGLDVRDDATAVRERVGYLPDASGVYGNLTVEEYLDFYGSIYGISAGKRRQLTEELLELVGLADRRNEAVRLLSRGMRQQLGLARCLIHDPQILLLDEPAGGMDPRARHELRDILQELLRLGKTILISSHLLGELAEVCTHLGIMRSGEIVAEGSIDEIMNAVSVESQLRITLADRANRERARQLLDELHSANGEIGQAAELSLLVTLDGTGMDAAGLVERLCSRGVRMTEFALVRPTLEDIVLQVTTMRAEA